MEFLRKLFVQTANHLRGLTLSQRLAIGLCVALIAMATLWLFNWAGTAEYVPLFDQPIRAEELARITGELDASDIAYRISGDRILVPAESKLRLQARLAQSNALPDDLSIGFAHLIENPNPWSSHESEQWRRNVALSNELSRVLRHFEGVRDARVFIDQNLKRTIGSSPITPTASIHVTLAPERELDKALVRAMASFVSRAVGGLELYKVQVTDSTGRTDSVARPDEAGGYDDLSDRREKERYFTEKLKELFRHVPGLQIGVHADLNPKATQVTERKFGKPATTRERSKTSETTEGGPGNEPGVVTNVTPNAGVAAAGMRSEQTETETEFDANQDETQTVTTTPRHELMSISASIGVPRSYLAALYKAANPGKEPGDPDLLQAPSTTKTLADIKSVAETIMPSSDTAASKVTVVCFAVIPAGPVVVVGGGGDAISYVRAYGSKAALGGLAVVSLLMMLMMVRKVGNGPVLPGEEPPPPLLGRGLFGRQRAQSRRDEPVESMAVADAPVGEAELSEHLLIGREVDENTVRAQKMVEQVADMIKEDPASAVGILQRWIAAEGQ